MSLVCLAGQVSWASADTFTWNVQFNSHSDFQTYGPIPPIDFAWSFEFNPVVFETQLQDNQPASLRTYSHFVGTGLTTSDTPLTADIWTTAPAGATFTQMTTASGSQTFIAGCCGFRDFTLMDQWESNDVDADPNVETRFRYLRIFGVTAQNSVASFADVGTFDAFSIIDFLAAANSPNFTPSMTEHFEITTTNLTTHEFTRTGGWWSGPAALTGHVPGEPTPVPEPASMVLVATGLLAAALHKRGRKTT